MPWQSVDRWMDSGHGYFPDRKISRSTVVSYKMEANQLQQFGSYIIKTTQTHKHGDKKEDTHGGNSNFPEALLKRPISFP